MLFPVPMAETMRNAEIAAAMDELGTLYELDGAVRYRVLAYREAARVIRQSPVSVAELARAGKATELPGIGATLEEKIVALLDTGDIPSAVKLRAKFPASLLEVTRIPGLGAKTVRRLYDELGVASLDDLREAAAKQRIRGLKGLGAKVEENVLASLEKMGEEGAPGRMLLSQVLPVAEELAAALREHPASDSVEIAGSARRRAETCKDIDLIATATDPEALARAIVEHPLVAQSGNPGASGARLVTHNGISVDLRIVAPDALGNLLQHFTGSAAHNIELRERAVAAGLSVSEHGITEVETQKVSRYATEAGVYKRLGLPYIEPELREGKGEIKAAADGGLPDLVEVADIKGDLHCHTTLSDGRNSLEEMAAGGPGPRLLIPGRHRPLRQPRLRRRRPARRAAGADRGGRGAEREAQGQALPAARRLGGEHQHRRVAGLRRRPARAARLGDRQRPHFVSDLG